ncbi:MAG: 4Fe-4S single cluster domain-containing protein [Myxococcales bacterium]
MSDVVRMAQFVPSTEAEGPGRRFALWVQGCPLRCPGCCNPEMLAFEGGSEWAIEALADRILATPGIEGLTLLGGEPVAQADALAQLCRRVRADAARRLSVVLFSGYTLAELRAMGPEVQDLLAQTDLLVDGRFDRSQPETRRRWVGSANQELHFLSSRYSPDDPAFAAPNTVEIRFSKGALDVNGWPALAAALRGPR